MPNYSYVRTDEETGDLDVKDYICSYSERPDKIEIDGKMYEYCQSLSLPVSDAIFKGGGWSDNLSKGIVYSGHGEMKKFHESEQRRREWNKKKKEESGEKWTGNKPTYKDKIQQHLYNIQSEARKKRRSSDNS
jgi:hypothetical protein